MMIKNLENILMCLSELHCMIEEELLSGQWSSEGMEELLRLRELIDDTSNIYNVEYMYSNLMTIYYNLAYLRGHKPEPPVIEMRVEYDEG